MAYLTLSLIVSVSAGCILSYDITPGVSLIMAAAAFILVPVVGFAPVASFAACLVVGSCAVGLLRKRERLVPRPRKVGPSETDDIAVTVGLLRESEELVERLPPGSLHEILAIESVLDAFTTRDPRERDAALRHSVQIGRTGVKLIDTP